MAQLPEGFQLVEQSAVALPEGFQLEDFSVSAQAKPARSLDQINADIKAAVDSGRYELVEPLKKEAAEVHAAQGTTEIGELGRGLIGAAETGATMVSGIGGEIAGGIAGTVQALNPFADSGAGAEAVESVRDALTYEPRTQKGQEMLSATGEALAPVGEKIGAVERAMGDSVYDATGSEALATVAYTLPTAMMEAIGLGAGGKIAKATKRVGSSGKSLLNEAVPDAPKLKDMARTVYKELDNSGVTMKPEVYQGMVSKIEKAAKKNGLSPRTTKTAMGALDDMKDVIGDSPDLSTIDDLRKVANGVAKNIDPTEKALGTLMVREIDDFLDKVSPKAFVGKDGKPLKTSDIADRYKTARNLYGRAKKSELVQEAIEAAKGRASGFENGLRIELSKLIKNKRTKNFFTKEEKAAIRDIEKGNKSQNIAKFFGRFAFNEGRANNVLSALGGVGAGSYVGGPVGAIAVPVAGQASRSVAQRLTKGRVDDLDKAIRGGKNAKEIADAYATVTPAKQRNADDLAKLLENPALDLEPLFNSASQKIRDAAAIAEGRKMIGQATGAALPAALNSEDKQQ